MTETHGRWERLMAKRRKAEGNEKALESESPIPKEKTPRKQESLKKVRIRLSESICMFPDKKIAESREGGVYEGELTLGDFPCLAIAVKLVAKNEENLKEARLLAKLKNHSHVISLIHSGFYHTDVQSSIYIALDKCHNENLREYVTNRKKQGIPFDLNRSTEIVNQIITGVEFIHDKKIIHKDLKPDNILFSLDQKLIKIADFGISEDIDAVSAKLSVKGQFGTKGYRPPESFGNGIISQKSDIFSLGNIFYYILSNGEHPFGDDSDIWNYNMKNGIIIDLSKLLVPNPKTTKHLIKCMIETKLSDRPTIWQVSQHPCWSGNEVECNFDYCCDEASNAPTYDEEETLCPIDDLWKLVEMLEQHTLKTSSAQDGQEEHESISLHWLEDLIVEILKKDLSERDEDDHDILLEFTRSLQACSNMTEPIRRALCKVMVLAYVENRGTAVLRHNERLDAWCFIINGYVRIEYPSEEEAEPTKLYKGESFGVEPNMQPQYHKGVMFTGVDDCQFICVRQQHYCEILLQGKDNDFDFPEMAGAQR